MRGGVGELKHKVGRALQYSGLGLIFLCGPIAVN